MRRTLTTLFLFTALSAGSAFAATTYSVTDLGTLGGSSSIGNAINDNGNAVGSSLDSSGNMQAFYWTPGGGIQNLGGTGTSEALDINNNEQVVGDSGGQAFRWTSSTGIVLIDNANFGEASGLNNSNTAIGYRSIGLPNRTLLWSSTNAITIPFQSNSVGTAINNFGQFVGVLPSSGIGYYDDGTALTTVSMLPQDINDSRQIVGALGGVATLLNFDTHTMTTLGKLSPTDTSSDALGINQAGTIVGASQGSGAFIADATTHQLSSLTTLLDPSFSGWTILTATDINNNGQIIGEGEFNGVDHAIILNAVPEPSSFVLFCVSLITAIAVYLWRKAIPLT